MAKKEETVTPLKYFNSRNLPATADRLYDTVTGDMQAITKADVGLTLVDIRAMMTKYWHDDISRWWVDRLVTEAGYRVWNAVMTEEKRHGNRKAEKVADASEASFLRKYK